jgi:hypothetical protein
MPAWLLCATGGNAEPARGAAAKGRPPLGSASYLQIVRAVASGIGRWRVSDAYCGRGARAAPFVGDR